MIGFGSRRAVTAALLLCAGACSLAGCGREEKSAPPPLRPVRTQQIFASDQARERSFSGIAQAGMETRLSFKVAGTIEALNVALGDRVQAGQAIARLDATDYRLQAEEAEASLHRQEAQQRNASAAYDRIRGLYESGHGSLGELDEARAAFESAEASVRSAEKALAAARNRLDYTRLNAPQAGSIAQVAVEEGENVNAGQVVALLSSGDRLEVQVAVPELLINRIREGSAVGVRFDAAPEQRFAATVTEVGVASGATATTYPVRVKLDELDEELRPGMAAEVAFSFPAEAGGERIVVPPQAVGEDRQGRFVFVVEADGAEEGTARRRSVEVGDLTREGLEILSGLADGDLLVTAGVNKLTDGRRVRLTSEGGP